MMGMDVQRQWMSVFFFSFDSINFLIGAYTVIDSNHFQTLDVSAS